MATRARAIRRAGQSLLSSTRTAVARIPPWPTAPPVLPLPAQTQTTSRTGRRLVSTTASRPSPAGPSWLLSALPNLSPLGPTPPPPKTIHARRQLPYPVPQVYALIADIDSYRLFLPHCTHSRVTRWTTPTSDAPDFSAPSTSISSSSVSTAGTDGSTNDGGRPPAPRRTRYPALADLTVGWGPFTQTYTSRVYCVPGSVVEAVSGRAQTSIPREVLRAVGYAAVAGHPDGGERADEMEGIFESLVTRWTVAPAAGTEGGALPRTEVTLSVTFQFANPALGLAVGQLADDKVDEMVAAFEGRARALYGR